MRASRTGVLDTPKSSARRASTSGVPGGSSPAMMPSSRRSYTRRSSCVGTIRSPCLAMLLPARPRPAAAAHLDGVVGRFLGWPIISDISGGQDVSAIDRRESVLEVVDVADAVRLAQEIVRIPSVVGGEGP